MPDFIGYPFKRKSHLEKGFSSYTRYCERCNTYFKSPHKHASVCNWCDKRKGHSGRHPEYIIEPKSMIK